MSSQDVRVTVRIIAHNETLFSDCLNLLSCDQCGADVSDVSAIHLTHDGPHGAIFVYCDKCYSARHADER